ncbi:WD40 repeat-like protein [Metschnikowia bicuspidata var. bicuspidata NRRL YB-4993]|uniref:WD40 repeat-like protein n=1 Tax=Metschnikowia bicuspidata var. bicuspidata NRRL YB-4993 TaxID=869754 RepID=A0A1A0HGR4_9ASCO|nr:WD40 repeat-like protein [Metschnikowia bicuspidata var. bicuspidata NRRL YB-4993]OBA23180.1 WD40 repeat-like protein [Metschnikowia bicuspidata var. bicuspidata NRRL YB-4993]
MRAFQTGHEELVHDIKYDFYGRHVATASSDQHVKVFDLDLATQTWVLNDSWKAHDSLVVRLLWAHPEFSSFKILALCSYDRTVKIWQEMPDELQGLGRRWYKLATLAVELFGPIYDVQFAPPHLGLKLACVGSDGIVRVYQLVEPADLLVWELCAEIPILDLQLPAKSLQSSFSIEWCPSKFAKTEKFAVIALDQGFAARSSDLLDEPSGPSERTPRYVKVCSLPEHNGLIRLVSWAPSMGRSHHLLATGCKDGYIRIFKAFETASGDLRVETVAKLNDHRQEVWRVEWNATGTILSSAGDDGKVRLWKCNYMNEWQCMSEINTSNRQDARAVLSADDPMYLLRPPASL